MKKAKTLFLSVIVLVAALGLLVFLYLGSAAKRVIETAGTAALGTKVSVSGLDISLADKMASMKGLSVANPQGFASQNIVQAKEISVKVGDVSKQLVTIDEIVVDGMTVNYELGTGGTNFDALRSNMPASAANTNSGTAAGANNGTAGNAKAPELIIHKLKILNAQVIPAIGKETAPISLPDLTLNDIGTQNNPATAREVAMKVMNKVLSASSTAVVTSGIANSVNKTVDKAAEKLKGLFGK